MKDKQQALKGGEGWMGAWKKIEDGASWVRGMRLKKNEELHCEREHIEIITWGDRRQDWAWVALAVARFNYIVAF